MTTEFDGDQFDEAYPPRIEKTWWQVARCRVIENAFHHHVPRSARVLEVGCGTGIVTSYLRTAGWNVSGAEIGEPQAGLHAKEHIRWGTNAVDLPIEERKLVDTLALFDVMEHVADAPAFLRMLLVAFPNAGQVVVTVPARKELWTTFDDHYGHFRRYDLAMLRNEFRAAGLRTERSRYFFHGLYPAILANNLMRGRKRNIRFRAPGPGMSTMLNHVIGVLFAAGSRVIPGSVPGSSIISVARRT